jgi:hypothetical protein
MHGKQNASDEKNDQSWQEPLFHIHPLSGPNSPHTRAIHKMRHPRHVASKPFLTAFLFGVPAIRDIYMLQSQARINWSLKPLFMMDQAHVRIFRLL